jgi:hypothetical protein
VDCCFTKEIWLTIQKDLKHESIWEGGHIADCLENWIRKKENWKEIPCFIFLEVWKHRNLVIFEDRHLNRVKVCNSILQDLGETKISYSTKVSMIDRPPILDWDLEVEFFDDASQDRGSKCGVGAMLKCPLLGTFKLKMNYGIGTNTRGVLLPLCSILFFSCCKKVTRLQLVGD